ncbi:MAG: CehA/McbA family metallohydrolase [Acidimicrobiales bacterium]|nr:CehA/McbA family metallohydrolase [Acidimicrobiales bacterium]
MTPPRGRGIGLALAGLSVVAALAAVPAAQGRSPATAAPAQVAPACAPGGPPVAHTGAVGPEDATTYRVLPFEVAPGTTRVEVGYSWTDELPLPDVPVVSDLVQTVFDLGLWDEGGVGTVEGFRGWSGSRQGRTARGQDPIWVQADSADRGYRPDPVRPGTWHVDLGVAAVAPLGATYEVVIRCLGPAVGEPFVDQPVDATHVADPDPGWYSGDLHLHGYHSNPNAPDWDGVVEFARAAGLDFLPITDYVTNQHHRELGPVQAANPDLVVWPSREVITYFGHATVFGETPHAVDWRHGHPGVTLGGIQAASVADGALFGVAHPTIFPTAVFASLCRGCEFRLGGAVDWDVVDTIEVITGPTMVDDRQLGGPGLGVQIQNPFILTALELWQRLLREGHKITAVSGSDDKLGPGYGTTVTEVYAEQLSRPALADALRAGHAYIRALGAQASPTVEMTAVTADGQRGMFGDVLHADSATVRVRVRGAAGQALHVSRDGLPADIVPIPSDDVTHTFVATRSPGSGPLGTFWRVDTVDLRSITTIGNPIFLAGAGAGAGPPTASPTWPSPAGEERGGVLPKTGGGGGSALPLVLAPLVLLAAVLHRMGRSPAGGAANVPRLPPQSEGEGLLALGRAWSKAARLRIATVPGPHHRTSGRPAASRGSGTMPGRTSLSRRCSRRRR